MEKLFIFSKKKNRDYGDSDLGGVWSIFGSEKCAWVRDNESLQSLQWMGKKGKSAQFIGPIFESFDFSWGFLAAVCCSKLDRNLSISVSS